ncbi:MAG: DUF4147 domain-containing protein [Gammaproteobacteria bacterium]|nr:MAG: DUF4147 domain-containing protein [Gammaproteobacteria bacterium]
MADPSVSLLRALWEAALAAADPAEVLPAALPSPPRGRTVVLAVGKAATRMAEVAVAAWPGPLEGLVVVPPGLERPVGGLELRVAGHPLPDAGSVSAAQAALALAGRLGPDDLLLCLLSGGGSALLAAPAPGLTLADKQAVTRALLASGAAIDEINCVRRHLSAIKGGRLAQAAWPARVVTLAVSDVVGDSPEVIASGPTVADGSTLAEARAVLARYGIDAPPAVAARLRDPAAETPKPGDQGFQHSDYQVVTSPRQVLASVAVAARGLGLEVVDLGVDWTGEAREVAHTMAAQALEARVEVRASGRARVLLSGGELTVTQATAGGRGGPNAEFVLALGLALADTPGVCALAADTDGIDGSGPPAGAFWTPELPARARALGLDLGAALAAHDSHGAFLTLGAALVTGRTGTNVNDLRAVLLLPA